MLGNLELLCVIWTTVSGNVRVAGQFLLFFFIFWIESKVELLRACIRFYQAIILGSKWADCLLLMLRIFLTALDRRGVSIWWLLGGVQVTSLLLTTNQIDLAAARERLQALPTLILSSLKLVQAIQDSCLLIIRLVFTFYQSSFLNDHKSWGLLSTTKFDLVYVTATCIVYFFECRQNNLALCDN